MLRLVFQMGLILITALHILQFILHFPDQHAWAQNFDLPAKTQQFSFQFKIGDNPEVEYAAARIKMN